MIGCLENLPENITAPRTDAIYNCHGYLTKVPLRAIEPFIETFTDIGDTVADFFAGSGMTGLAAIRMGRKARLSDISALGRHIATGYATSIKPDVFRKRADRILASAGAAVGDFYTTRRATDSAKVEMVRTVWSFTYVCPRCESPFIYYQHLSSKGAPPKTCPYCPENFVRRKWRRGPDVPVVVVARNDVGRQTEQPVSDYDLNLIDAAAKDARRKDVPSLTIDKDREMYSRSGLGKTGMVKTSDFFSPRNAIALLELWKEINSVENPALRQKLRFSFTAILPRASRRYQWSAQRPLNAQNQTYYIAPVYYEWNVFELFDRKIEAALRSDEILLTGTLLLTTQIQQPDIDYTLASADALTHLKTESVDYIFTDPPFGSNIFYSDMNLFHEAWLGQVTDHASEAVVHTTGSRKKNASSRYEQLLFSAFSEAFRVLKPGRYMSVVFGNSSGQIWGLVQRAIRDAGFKAAPVHVAILDKGQRSVKGLNSGSEGVVTVDLILTVQKPAALASMEEAHILQSADTQRLIEEVIEELSADETRNPSYVYATMLRRAICKHYTLDHLHLGDVLLALRNAGYATNKKTGLIQAKKQPQRELELA